MCTETQAATSKGPPEHATHRHHYQSANHRAAASARHLVKFWWSFFWDAQPLRWISTLVKLTENRLASFTFEMGNVVTRTRFLVSTVRRNNTQQTDRCFIDSIIRQWLDNSADQWAARSSSKLFNTNVQCLIMFIDWKCHSFRSHSLRFPKEF